MLFFQLIGLYYRFYTVRVPVPKSVILTIFGPDPAKWCRSDRILIRNTADIITVLYNYILYIRMSHDTPPPTPPMTNLYVTRISCLSSIGAASALFWLDSYLLNSKLQLGTIQSPPPPLYPLAWKYSRGFEGGCEGKGGGGGINISLWHYTD